MMNLKNNDEYECNSCSHLHICQFKTQRDFVKAKLENYMSTDIITERQVESWMLPVEVKCIHYNAKPLGVIRKGTMI